MFLSWFHTFISIQCDCAQLSFEILCRKPGWKAEVLLIKVWKVRSSWVKMGSVPTIKPQVCGMAGGCFSGVGWWALCMPRVGCNYLKQTWHSHSPIFLPPAELKDITPVWSYSFLRFLFVFFWCGSFFQKSLLKLLQYCFYVVTILFYVLIL